MHSFVYQTATYKAGRLSFSALSELITRSGAALGLAASNGREAHQSSLDAARLPAKPYGPSDGDS